MIHLKLEMFVTHWALNHNACPEEYNSFCDGPDLDPNCLQTILVGKELTIKLWMMDRQMDKQKAMKNRFSHLSTEILLKNWHYYLFLLKHGKHATPVKQAVNVRFRLSWTYRIYHDSFLGSGKFCCLLITFANGLGPDQDDIYRSSNRHRSWSGSKPFDPHGVFLKEFFENVNFKKWLQTTEAWKITEHAKS